MKGFSELRALSENILKSICNRTIDSGAVLNLALCKLEESFSAVVEYLQFNFDEIGDVYSSGTAIYYVTTILVLFPKPQYCLIVAH